MNPVLLINPSSRAQIYQGLDRVAAIEPPVWCRLLSSYLKRKAIPTVIADMEFAYDTKEALRWYMSGTPSLVAIVVYGHQPSASTQTMPAAIEICKWLQEYDVPVVVLGTHPAALPERTLEETNADFVCTGEGFVTLWQLSEYVKEKKEAWKYLVTPDFPKGVCYWDHGEPQRTNPAPLVWNMDEIPGGEWSKLAEINGYRAHNWHAFGREAKGYASIYTSLGCPYACSFCCIQAPFHDGDRIRFHGLANSYRMWSPEHVADEITTLVERYDITNIKISDEMFLLNRRHVEGIVNELENRGFSDGLNIWFYSRIDTVGDDDALLYRMRRVGFRWAALGIESASPESLEAVDKRDYDNIQTEAAVRRLQQAGISVIGNYIFGLPGDTWETMNATLELAQELQTEFVNMYCNVAFPGSQQYDDLIATGWMPPPWSSYSFHAYEHQPLETKMLNADEVLAFRDAAFVKYFENESYQEMIRIKFGDSAVDSVRRMLKVPLRRKLLE